MLEFEESNAVCVCVYGMATTLVVGTRIGIDIIGDPEGQLLDRRSIAFA